jgi:mono/diheme cytochrome c family protein
VGLLSLASSAVHCADAPPAQFADGAASFQANCAVCHGAAGTGLPSLAPPLTSYPARYATSPEGRRQLAMTVLFGLFGEITVDDKHFDFKMPDFSRLDDATLAATLNFVVFDLGHAAASVRPLSAADIAAERAQPLDGAAVREHRKTVAQAAP